MSDCVTVLQGPLYEALYDYDVCLTVSLLQGPLYQALCDYDVRLTVSLCYRVRCIKHCVTTTCV